MTLRVAVVGAGPTGYYAADALTRTEAGASDVDAVRVDLFDRLPTPYGLVRGGVAPDHPKIKNVIRVYEKIGGREAVRFFGNVTIGRDLSIDELRAHYDAVLLAYGSETDRRLGIPGEDLPGSHTATEFVGWYNGHPDYRDRHFDLSAEVAVVIGQGNVAMDVSRILAKTVDELRATDIAAHALEALAESRIREVHLVGRRGPAQAKFTPPEIKEIGELADCDPIVDPADLELDPASLAELEEPSNKHAQQNVEVLREFAARVPSGKSRRYVIRNFASPVEIRGGERVQSLVLERNVLEGEPFAIRARGTGEREVLECGLVFRSIGYSGLALPGVPFDDGRGVVPTESGRVVDAGGVVPGLYAAGWIKRGPSGVIGTNKPCAGETAEAILADAAAGKLGEPKSPEPLLTSLAARGLRVVDDATWKRIDAAEVERGAAVGKPREKFTRIDEMTALI